MIHNCKQEIVYIAQLGKVPTAEINQVIFLANQIQKKVHFEYLSVRLPLEKKYKLKNGSYDLCNATKHSLTKIKDFRTLPRPLIVLSSEAMGDPDYPDEPGDFYFLSKEEDYDKDVTVISLQPKNLLPKTRSLQDYILMMLSTFLLCQYANLSFHNDIRGCALDYCDELQDLENGLRIARLCNECEEHLQAYTRQNKVSPEIIASAIRLLNRAAKRKYCFIAMPIRDDFKKVHKIINESFIELGWDVKRIDEIMYPRLITSRIYREILTSDLVVADLSKFNPNVFYEVGLAHVVGNDLLLLSQEDTIPFDLKNEQTIFYKATKLNDLKNQIKKQVGSIFH